MTRQQGKQRMEEDYKELTRNPIKRSQHPDVKQKLMYKKTKRKPRIKPHNKERKHK